MVLDGSNSPSSPVWWFLSLILGAPNDSVTAFNNTLKLILEF